MAFHQIIVSAAPGDAATNAALEMRALLRRVGPSEIFAANVHDDIADEVVALTPGRRPALAPQDTVIFHATIGAPEVFELLWALPHEVVLYYHNVSPSEPFRGYSPDFAQLLREGRRAVAELAPRVRLALAPSTFNASELLAMGYQDVRISPLIVDVHRLRSLEPHAETRSRLDEVTGPLLLSVGQFLPHKRADYLIKAFHILSTFLLPGAELALIGASRLPAYRTRLDAFVRELQLPGLRMVGAVADDVLAAYYDRAELFVTASEHEGVCVPLIEAMTFDVPIVARDFGAVPETLAGSGLLLDRADGPGVFAEAMSEVLSRTSRREGLVSLGRERCLDFDPDTARAALLSHLLDVA